MASQAELRPPQAAEASEDALLDLPPLRNYEERLGLIYPLRQTMSITGGAVTGLFMGLSLGAKTSALRFRAENAHRLPTSHKGWYLYHKSKNYYAMFGGLKEGIRMGVKIGFWAGAFVGAEATIDDWRNGTKDALSTVIAGLSCAAAFSAWNRFTLVTAAKTARLSLFASLGFGLSQDALRLLRGKEVTYVSFVKRRLLGLNEPETG